MHEHVGRFAAAMTTVVGACSVADPASSDGCGLNMIQRPRGAPVTTPQPPQDFQRRLSYDIPTLARRVPQSTEILFIHGSDDDTVPPAESQECAARIPHARFLAVCGNHNFTGAGEAQQMIRPIVAFAKGEELP